MLYQIDKHLHAPEQLLHPRLTMSTPRSVYDGKGPKNCIQLLHTRAEECMCVVVCGCCATKLFIWRFSSWCNNVRTTTIGTIRQPKLPWLHFTPRNKVGEQSAVSCHTWVWTTPKWDATIKSETNTHLSNSRCILGLVACVTMVTLEACNWEGIKHISDPMGKSNAMIPRVI